MFYRLTVKPFHQKLIFDVSQFNSFYLLRFYNIINQVKRLYIDSKQTRDVKPKSFKGSTPRKCPTINKIKATLGLHLLLNI